MARGQPRVHTHTHTHTLSLSFYPTAVSVRIRVTWATSAPSLGSLSLAWLPLAPGLPPRPAVPMGINLDPPNYYNPLFPFADLWQAGPGVFLFLVLGVGCCDYGRGASTSTRPTATILCFFADLWQAR